MIVGWTTVIRFANVLHTHDAGLPGDAVRTTLAEHRTQGPASGVYAVSGLSGDRRWDRGRQLYRSAACSPSQAHDDDTVEHGGCPLDDVDTACGGGSQCPPPVNSLLNIRRHRFAEVDPELLREIGERLYRRKCASRLDLRDQRLRAAIAGELLLAQPGPLTHRSEALTAAKGPPS